jgi:hypothetical protein
MKLALSTPAPLSPATGRASSSLRFHLANAGTGVATLVAASPLLADPALAFRVRATLADPVNAPKS